MYTIEEVAETFKVSISLIRRLVFEGKIKAVKVGEVWRITEEEVERIKREGAK